MTGLGRPWPLAIVASCVAASLATLLDAGSPVRVTLAFWFFLTCPGMAVIGMLGIRDRLSELTLAIALSLALDTAVALVMVLARIWSPGAAFVVLIGISLLGATLQVQLRSRGQPLKSTLPGSGASP